MVLLRDPLAHYDPRDPPQKHGGETYETLFAHSKEQDLCDISHVYVTLGKEEEEIYPPTISQIAEEQRRSRAYKPYFKSKKPKKVKLDRQISLKVIDDTEILVRDNERLVIPSTLPSWIGIITTYSIQERRDSRKPSKPLCIGQV